MCCLCIQFTHENTSERTILHLVKKKDPLSKVWLLALQKRLATPLAGSFSDNFYNSDGKDCNCVPLILQKNNKLELK